MIKIRRNLKISQYFVILLVHQTLKLAATTDLFCVKLIPFWRMHMHAGEHTRTGTVTTDIHTQTHTYGLHQQAEYFHVFTCFYSTAF